MANITEFKGLQYTETTVEIGDYMLRHLSYTDGSKHNEATRWNIVDECWEFVALNSAEMKPLFIALHNFKTNKY